jgi:alkanesulfonate monooxygenase SsuD/methylene tetrahydromethanopterin reductase-like flavin-dependent oxidoreductase (luciferase family)
VPNDLRLGVMFDHDRPPEELTEFAVAAEEAGADDVWVVEDLGWAASISSAALALGATRRIRVGIGVAPVPLRNPALLAMELATLARVFPGRLMAGVGHGVSEWMDKVGAGTTQKLALLEENITALHGLLRGDTVTMHGRQVTIDGVRLVHPPAVVPPIVTGVVGPRSLELSGRVADGTIVPEGKGPDGIVAARGHIERGRSGGSPRAPHDLIVFAFLHIADDPDRAADTTRATLAAQAAWLGVPVDELFSVIGPADAIAGKVAALHAAGAGTVVLRPLGPDQAGQARAALRALGR